MNRLLFFLFLTLVSVGSAFAQKEKSHKEMRREVMEFKLKYIAQEIDLKEDQQKQFLDLYKQMTDERVKIFRETKALERKLTADGNASEADYEAVTKAITAAKEKDAAIEKKYDEKFAEFLSPKQIFKMKGAEESFRKKMHEMRHKKRKH